MIKLGIIGYGSWVKNAYLPGLKHDGRAEIAAISARSSSTLNSIEKDFGNKVEVFADYMDLLKSPGIQAVMIAVPDPMHSRIITAAVNSGKDVFYEPPVADTRQSVPEALKLLVSSQQITHADLELALVPAVSKASDLIKKKYIGNIYSAGIRLQSGWGPDPDQDLNNINRLSVWYAHVLNVLLDSVPERILILDGKGTRGRRQSQSTGIYDYNGIWGELRVNIDSPVKLSINVEIVGDEGDIHIDLLTGELKTRTKNNPDWKVEYFPAIRPYADWPGMNESITAFLDAVESRKPGYANAEVVAKLHLVGMAAEESKDTGTWARIKSLSDLF